MRRASTGESYERSLRFSRFEYLGQAMFGKRAMNIFYQAVYPIIGMLCQTI
jgi:hypothetical protein